MGYRDPIVAGTALVIPAIQSPNYVAGVSGWAIFRNGNAEFNNGAFRGDLSIGNPPTTGLLITSTVPTILQTFYSSLLTSISDSAILLYSGDGSYYYQIAGLRPSGAPNMFMGSVDKFGATLEWLSILIGIGAIEGVSFTDAQATNKGIIWGWGTDYGASRTVNNTAKVNGTDWQFGPGTGDTGSVTSKVPVALPFATTINGTSVGAGVLDGVNVTTTGALTAGVSAETDISNLQLTANVVTGRTYRIFATVLLTLSVNTDQWRLNLRTTTAVTGTKIGEADGIGSATAAIDIIYQATSTGSVTFFTSFARQAGTGVITPFGSPGGTTVRTYSYIEDISPTTSWRTS